MDMFNAANLDYPTDDWTFEDMREAAILLTLDEDGRNPTDPAFDPEKIVQWGWNGGLTFFWQRHLVRPFGGDFCANADCTSMNFTMPETIEALEWWANLTHDDFATLYDPYGGSQTGIPGDPFISGKAAMGFNGFFAIGQLNDAGQINYDVIQPFLGATGQRHTPLSSNGYVIAANSEHPDAAWELIQALTTAEFLSQTWGQPGHSIPALRQAADSILNPDQPPANQAAMLEAMEYGEVFKPYTSSAFTAYGATSDLFIQAMRGDRPVGEIAAEIEQAANQALADDR
jgi:multiple sugar transport system substrate-binding protein